MREINATTSSHAINARYRSERASASDNSPVSSLSSLIKLRRVNSRDEVTSQGARRVVSRDGVGARVAWPRASAEFEMPTATTDDVQLDRVVEAVNCD